jgi:hypothetical protein
MAALKPPSLADSGRFSLRGRRPEHAKILAKARESCCLSVLYATNFGIAIGQSPRVAALEPPDVPQVALGENIAKRATGKVSQ